MHVRRNTVLLAIALLTLPSAGAWAGAPSALAAHEVRVLLAGNTMDGETRLARFEREEVRAFQVYVREDGTLTVRNFEGNTDTGVWDVTDEGLYCNQYRHTRRGMRKCYQVLPSEAGYALLDVEAGSVSTVFTVRPGNPEAL